jgi:hypothetical protein
MYSNRRDGRDGCEEKKDREEEARRSEDEEEDPEGEEEVAVRFRLAWMRRPGAKTTARAVFLCLLRVAALL